MKVYVLWHVYELSDDFGKHDEEKYELDSSSWNDGFTTVRYGK